MAMLSNLTQGLYVTLIEAKHHGKLGISASFDYGPPRPTRRAQPPAAPSARWPRAPTRRPPAAPPRPPHARHGASLHVSYTRLNGRENSREGGGGPRPPREPLYTPRRRRRRGPLARASRTQLSPRSSAALGLHRGGGRRARGGRAARVPRPRAPLVLSGHAASLPLVLSGHAASLTPY